MDNSSQKLEVSFAEEQESVVTQKSEEHRSSKLEDTLIFSDILTKSELHLPEDLSNNPMLKLEVGERRVLSWHHYQ